MPRIEQARARGEKFRIAVLGRARKALAPIAAALREASIPFRAVELGELERPPRGSRRSRPRPRPAQSSGPRRMARCSARAVVRPFARRPSHTRQLPTIQNLLDRPIPDLLAERIDSAQRRRPASPSIASSMLSNPCPTLRCRCPPLSRNLARAGLARLGRSALRRRNRARQSRSALELPRHAAGWRTGSSRPRARRSPRKTHRPARPCSQPANAACSLMTIHKSKGLEFEVVIVPELQARSGSSASQAAFLA